MTYKDIKYIDESWIDEKLSFLEYFLSETSWTDKEYNKVEAQIELLKEIKQNLTSATPILEKAFNKGRDYQRNFGIINSFEQFLNTEVNI